MIWVDFYEYWAMGAIPVNNTPINLQILALKQPIMRATEPA
jgi:hypothetical protein